MSEDYVEGNFLGLPETGEDVDVVVLPLPYELTTSYGQGTAQGPAACIASSGHVELFDAELGIDLPASLKSTPLQNGTAKVEALQNNSTTSVRTFSHGSKGIVFPSSLAVNTAFCLLWSTPQASIRLSMENFIA